MLDTNEAPFLRAIAEGQNDNAAHLVFADWLEERGRSPRAEFIRVQCELASAKLADSAAAPSAYVSANYLTPIGGNGVRRSDCLSKMLASSVA